MGDSFSCLDYGEQLVMRFRASGLTRREFAAQKGISVSALDYYVRRERSASMPATFAPNRILPVDLIAAETEAPEVGAAARYSGVAVRLANGRAVEVRRGFDAQLLRDVLAVVETPTTEERG